MLVTKTYAIVSEESSKNGDFEDSGFCYEDCYMTVSELINDMTIYAEACCSNFSYYSGYYFTEADPDVDLFNGDYTYNSWHITECSPQEWQLLVMALQKQIKIKDLDVASSVSKSFVQLKLVQ
jgi:hypothetical protein